MKELFLTKYDCCGCTACYSVCPVNAISMLEDEEGFKYPTINLNMCINCNKCIQVCPLKSEKIEKDPIRIIAANNKNESVRKKSSSGGIFSLLAEHVEKKNGVIYGAAFDENFRVIHMRAESENEWCSFRGSKYVQSDLNNTFKKVKKDLEDNRYVLFTGTPCQIDGLIHYLNNQSVNQERLLTCDIICHGVSSPLIWDEYVQYIGQTNGKIANVFFRDKEINGWHNSTLTMIDEKGNTIFAETKSVNMYFQLFSCGQILRPACHQCHYSSFSRISDITIGDYWGIEEKYPTKDDDKGISLVIVNSLKGKSVIQEILGKMSYFDVSKKECEQPNLLKPSEESLNRNRFWYWFRKYGLKTTGQSMGYLPMDRKEKLTKYVYLVIEKIISITLKPY